MDNGGSDGIGCFEIKIGADTVKFTSMRIAGFGQCKYNVFGGTLNPTLHLPASVCASMSLSVCLHDKTKTAKTIITKLAPSRVLTIHLILSQNVTFQGHRRRPSGRHELCTVSSA